MMKKIMVMALAVMSVLIMGCAPAAGPDSSNGPVVISGDQNGATITVSGDGTILRNVTNASLVINSNVKSLVFENSKLKKVTANSNAELCFSNTQIEELESNGNVVIKGNTTTGAGRSARAANPDKQAEKAKVVIDKLVMKGNVQAGVGLYKKIERAANASDKYFEFPEESTARVENYDDGVNATLDLSPVYEGFDGVKIDVTNKPANVPGKSQMDVNLKKGDMENEIFWGHNKDWGNNVHNKAIVEGDYFYWPFLEANKDYEFSITYRAENDNGSGSKLLASKTVKVTPTRGKGDVEIFLDENKGTMELKEEGDIVWTKQPQQIFKDANANVSYELFKYDNNGVLAWITEKRVKTDCEGGAFDGFNIYKDGFFPALDDRNNIYNNKVFLIMNYNLESFDKIGGEEYKYSIHTPITKKFSNEITFDKSKYEPAFDVELDKENKCINITIQPSNKAKALWKMTGGTKLWFRVVKGETPVEGTDGWFEIDSLPQTPISLGNVTFPEGALELQVQLCKDNPNNSEPPIYVDWVIKKTVQ